MSYLEDKYKKGGRPKGTTIKKKVIYQKEFDLFLVKLEADKEITEYRKTYTRKAVCLLLNGGFRVNEITALTCDDICDAVEHRQIHLANNTKTKTSRDVYFSRKAVEKISKVFAYEIEHCGNKLVFHGRGGSYDKVNVSSFTSEINKLLKKYLGQNFGTHSLRHGYTTDIVKKFGVRIAQVTIGHKNPSTTMRYVEVTEDDIIEAIENIR